MKLIGMKPGHVIRGPDDGPPLAVFVKGFDNGDAMLVLRDSPDDTDAEMRSLADKMRDRFQRKGAARRARRNRIDGRVEN